MGITPSANAIEDVEMAEEGPTEEGLPSSIVSLSNR